MILPEIQIKSLAVLQTKNLLIAANNSIFACLKGNDRSIRAMIDEVLHILHHGGNNATQTQN